MRCATPFLALALLATAFPSASAHEETPDCGLPSDAGDAFHLASLVALPVDCDGQLHSTFDSVDYYKFDCSLGQAVRARLTSSSHFINLRAYLPVSGALPPIKWDSTTRDGEAIITFSCNTSGQYRIQLLHGENRSGQYDVPYRLEIAFA